MKKITSKNTKEGMILAFTLGLLLLIAMMGVYVLSSSRTELSITGHNRVGRQAFNTADTAAGLATLMGRILLHPELGDPLATINSDSDPTMPIEIDINDDRFTLAKLQEESHTFNYTERYLEALEQSSSGKDPHITFSVNNKVVASAIVSLEADKPIDDGKTLDVGNMNDKGTGAGVQVNLVITVNGGPVEDSAYSQDDQPRSVITAIYRDFL